MSDLNLLSIKLKNLKHAMNSHEFLANLLLQVLVRILCMNLVKEKNVVFHKSLNYYFRSKKFNYNNMNYFIFII